MSAFGLKLNGGKLMNDFDLTEFAKMFDAALASNNPSVKKALQNFMMIAAIVHAQDQNQTNRITGPFETLIKQVGQLQRMVSDMQATQKYYTNQYSPTYNYNYNTSTTSALDYNKYDVMTGIEISKILEKIPGRTK
jgi:hypothetical protein